MKKLAFVFLLLVSGLGAAQTIRYLARDVLVEDVYLFRDPNNPNTARMMVTATKRPEDAGTSTINDQSKRRECDISTLSAAERACLVTVRNAARTCFAASEGAP